MEEVLDQVPLTVMAELVGRLGTCSANMPAIHRYETAKLKQSKRCPQELATCSTSWARDHMRNATAGSQIQRTGSEQSCVQLSPSVQTTCDGNDWQSELSTIYLCAALSIQAAVARAHKQGAVSAGLPVGVVSAATLPQHHKLEVVGSARDVDFQRPVVAIAPCHGCRQQRSQSAARGAACAVL